MSISPYFQDSSIVNQLRSFFDVDEQWEIDFDSCLSQIEDVDEEYYVLKVRDKSFRIHKVQGFVELVE